MDEQRAEDDAKKVKEDDVMTWTGKTLRKCDMGPGKLTKRKSDTESLIMESLEEQEPVKKRPKAGNFGNFAGW